MRERLIATMVGLTLVVILLFGVPRAYTLADLVRDQETGEVERTADDLVLLVGERQDGGGTVDPTLLRSPLETGDRAEYTSADGASVVSGAPVDGDGAIEVSRALPDGSTVTVWRSGSVVSERVTAALQPLLLVGLVLALVSAVVGYLLARRFSRPFRELADAASLLGRGRFELALPRYAVPEAEQIRVSLQRAAGDLERMVRREREFAANASHQLRTPITALRLELEDLTQWPDTTGPVREELGHALGEVDRLSTVIDDLVALARTTRDGTMADVDLVALVADGARRWEPRASARGRAIRLAGPDTLPARLAPGPVGQVLDVLVDNALVHGSGTITITVADEVSHLTVRVADEGAARPGPEVFERGVSTRDEAGDEHGIGLAVAEELIELYGGRIRIEDAATTTFVLMLPQGRASDRPAL